MNVILQTQNLVLKPIQVSDAEAIFHFFTPTVTTYMYPAPAKTIQDTLDFIQSSIKLREEQKEIVWVARLQVDETFVGCMGLHHINTRTPELGVWIQEGFFGKHLGLEAMTEVIGYAREHVPHDYLIYPVDRRNYPSRNIPESFGGILKKTYQTTNRAGNVLDIIEYWIYPHHQDMNTWPTFLFQGDSITDCGRNRLDLLSLGDGYVKQLKHAFPHVRFINKGISGDRTEELIKRWDEDVIFYQPDVLSLLCGVNDVWHYYHFGKPIDQATFEKNYIYLIETTQKKSPHTTMILIEPFSYSIGAFDPLWRPMLESFIHTVRKLARHYHLPIIHMDDHMQAWKKIYAQEAVLGDGVHPSELGHRLMAQAIKPILRDYLLDIQEKRLSDTQEVKPMDKPVNKKQLLDMSETRYLDIMTMISELSAKERIKEWKTKERDKNLRDLIYHLYAWHQLLLRWLKILGEGGKPALPKEGYTWDDLDALNHEIWQEAQQHPLMDTLERFEMSHQLAMSIIKELPEEAIFKPYYVQFNHPILSLVDGCMADHYHWALDKLKEHYV